MEKKIADALPSYFGIIVDRWLQQSEHFIGIFRCFQNEGFSEKALLAISVLPDGTDLWSDSICSFIEFALGYYETRSEEKFIVNSNEPTMRAVAKKLMIPMIGCASHQISSTTPYEDTRNCSANPRMSESHCVTESFQFISRRICI